jgi:hypothetical protein
MSHADIFDTDGFEHLNQPNTPDAPFAQLLPATQFTDLPIWSPVYQKPKSAAVKFPSETADCTSTIPQLLPH